MSDGIKTRQVRKDIKVLDKAVTASAHMKRAYVRTSDSAGQTQQQGHADPAEYAENKVLHGADRAAHATVFQMKRQGGKTVNRVKGKCRTAKVAGQIEQELAEGEKDCQKKGRMIKAAQTKEREQPARQGAGQKAERPIAVGKEAQHKAVGKRGGGMREQPKRGIKTAGQGKETVRATKKAGQAVKPSAKREAKAVRKSVKTAERTARTVAKTRRQAARAARKASERAARSARLAVKETRRAIRATAKLAISTAKAAIVGAKALVSAIAAGGWAVILILVIVILFGAALGMMGGGNSGTVSPVSAEVEAYGAAIQKYASQYGIGEYAELVKAVMMQESGGKGKDPMQSSQCPYNKRYPRKPNGITDPDYSIACGVQALEAALQESGTESPIDMEHIKLALQGYNYGNGYIPWAKKNYGGDTAANAAEFSDMMAGKMGWGSYGDKQYVPHVLRYYALGRIPAGIGNQAIVHAALTQEGNGGAAYWSWYGFESRVEWCACFVSWCANECGYLDSGAIPKFSLCSDGAQWFVSMGQFQDGSYVPAAGDIIFFDWKNDGRIDHVGIVEDVRDGAVHTIEGNSKDKVARRSYPIGDPRIHGYGVPAY